MSHVFYRTAQEGRMPHAPFRRRSRPLGQAYAPSEVSGILFFERQVKGKTIFGVIGYYVYGKIKLYARPKITTT